VHDEEARRRGTPGSGSNHREDQPGVALRSLSSEPLLLTHKHEPDSNPVSVNVHSGVEHSDPVGDVS
jgi:hypothetical protein